MARGRKPTHKVTAKSVNGWEISAPLQRNQQSSIWYLNLRKFKGPLMSLRTTDEARARILAETELARLGKGAPVVAPRRIAKTLSFAAMARQFADDTYGTLPYRGADRVYARTLELEAFLNKRTAELGVRRDVWGMKRPDALAFRQYLREFLYADDNGPMAHETAKKRWQAAVAFWEYCERQDLTEGSSPFHDLHPPEPPARAAEENEGEDRARGVFTLGQLAAIEALCELKRQSSRHATRENAEGALVLLYTGARPIEVTNLRVEDVDTQAWMVRLRSRKAAGSRGRGIAKSMTSRRVDIIPKLRPLLAARKANAEAKKRTFLFTNTSGEQLTVWWGSWRKWFEAAGVPLLNPAGQPLQRYSFRNTFTAVMQAWVPDDTPFRVTDIQGQLGHASVVTTERYLSAWPRQLRFSSPPDYAAWLADAVAQHWPHG